MAAFTAGRTAITENTSIRALTRRDPISLPRQFPPTMLDVLTGFLSADGNALGRPVGVALDKTGALLVADDVGNIIWRVAAVR